MDSRTEKANKIIRNNVMFSTGAGVIPVPLLDIAAVTAVQLDLIRQLCNLYNQNYSEVTGKAFITSLSGATLARFGASFIKTIPVVGSIVGGVSMAVLSGASTYALGQVCISAFSAGADLEDIDMNSAKKMYKEQFEEGKKVAQDLKDKKEKGEQIEEDAYASLVKLGQLRDKGIITDEEFQKKKESLLAVL